MSNRIHPFLSYFFLKKSYLILLILFISSGVQAQKCKMAKVKKRDREINITSKTKGFPIAQKGLSGVEGTFFIQNDSIYLTLYYNSQKKKTRRIHKEDPIVWNTDSGELIKIYPLEDAQSSFFFQGLLSSTSFFVIAHINPELLQQFQEASFQNLNINTHLKRGGEQEEVLKITNGFAKKIRRAATCISFYNQ